MAGTAIDETECLLPALAAPLEDADEEGEGTDVDAALAGAAIVEEAPTGLEGVLAWPWLLIVAWTFLLDEREDEGSDVALDELLLAAADAAAEPSFARRSRSAYDNCGLPVAAEDQADMVSQGPGFAESKQKSADACQESESVLAPKFGRREREAREGKKRSEENKKNKRAPPEARQGQRRHLLYLLASPGVCSPTLLRKFI